MLSRRLLSAFALMPIVGFFVYYGGFLFAIALGIVAALALNEFFGMLSQQGDRPLRLLGGGATALLILNGLGLGETLPFAALALVVFGGLIWQLASTHEDTFMRGWALTIAGVFYIGLPLGMGVSLREIPDPALGGLPSGLYWVAITAFGTWACDTGAYFAGRFLGGKLSGGRKFSPRWSPNKTWEGFFGGWLTCVAVVTILWGWFFDFPLWQGVMLGLLLGPAALFGDLAESMVKRRVGVKDSGALIPGHGGMLDRIDSILFTATVAYFFARWIVY